HIDAFCVLQDDAGFIWIGTGNGLQRYDGYQLKNYFKDNDSISTNIRINSMTVIGDVLWINSKGGLLCFHTKKEKYLQIKSNYELKNKSTFIKYHHSNDNQLWILADSILLLATYSLTNDVLLLDLQKKTLPNIPANTILKSLEHNDSGTFWIVAKNRTWQYHYRDDIFVYTNSFLTSKVSQIFYEPNSQYLWVQSAMKIQRFSFKGNEYLEYVSSELNNLRSELELTANPMSDFKIINNEYWIASTHKGIYRLSSIFPQVSIIEKYHTNSDVIPLSSNSIKSLFLSRENCLWVSLNDKGLDIVDLGIKKFSTLKNKTKGKKENQESPKSISEIYEDYKGNFWIGTKENGLWHYNSQQEQFAPFKKATSQFNKVAMRNILEIAGYKNILYIASAQGLSIYNHQTNHFVFYSRNDTTLFNFNKNIRSLAVDQNNVVWVGYLHGGIHRTRFGADGKVLDKIYYDSLPRSKAKVQIKKVTNILVDTALNQLVITNERCLHRLFLDKQSQIFKSIPYRIEPDNMPLLDGVSLWDTKKQNDSTYWIGSIGNGLLRVSLSDSILQDGYGYNICTSYLRKKIAYGNHIQSLLLDDIQNVWFSSNGICQFNTQNKKFRNFDVGDGLISNGFIVKTGLKSNNGNMYFGSTEGIIQFHPDSIDINQALPQIVISNIFVNKQPIKQDLELEGTVIYNGKKLLLNHKQNSFTIEFSALHFANTGKNRYKYKLQGYDDDWIYTDSKMRRAKYANLKYGDYTFLVNGTNNDGLWSDTHLELQVHIKTPIWKSKVAIMLYIVFIIVIIITIYRYNIGMVKLRHNLQLLEIENKNKEELHQTKLRFFTNISHELKTPLNLIYSPIELLIKDSDIDKQQRLQLYRLIGKNINRVLKLVNELIEFRKIETGRATLCLSPINLIDYIEEIIELFREPMENKKINFASSFSNSNVKFYIDADKVSKIVINLLSNAIKYTPEEGHIHLKLLQDFKESDQTFSHSFHIKNNVTANEYFYLVVSDTGIGITEDTISQIFERYYQVKDTEYTRHIGSGIGLALVKSLVIAHKGELLVNSEKNKGTEFIVKIPSTIGFYDSFSNIEIVEKTQKDDFSKINISEIIDNESTTTDDYLDKNTIDRNKKTLLVVEDNYELRHFLKGSLMNDYNILTASNGKKACDALSKIDINLIISDVEMPHMDGYDFTNFVKSNINYCHIPIVLLTAKNSMEEKEKGVQSGADIYISKPFSIEFLKKSVENIFKHQELLFEKYRSNHTMETSLIARNDKDKDFLEQVEKSIEKLMINPDFKLSDLYHSMGISRSPFTNKIKALTGLSPNELVKNVRLKTATKLLIEGKIDISQVAFKVGFKSQSYFGQVFKQAIGCTPTEFIEKNHSEINIKTNTSLRTS
ncbi:MAG: ATP-binding protein, partial [Bacteroidales bacterium]|nr:ATP-binding protein [Bacteroidales bacterium]